MHKRIRGRAAIVTIDISKRRDNMEYIIGCIVGFILSWIFVKFRFKNGDFQVNETDADKDVYKLIINDFDKLHKRRYLLVRITRK